MSPQKAATAPRRHETVSTSGVPFPLAGVARCRSVAQKGDEGVLVIRLVAPTPGRGPSNYVY